MVIHLDSDIFDIVLNGTKNIECRVNDEKRRKLKIGDTLTFLRRPDDIEKIDTIIEDLVYFDTFEELVNDYNMEDLYLKDYTKKELGTTTNLNEAGYLTNDGEYLDFSGKKQGSRGGQRQIVNIKPQKNWLTCHP